MSDTSTKKEKRKTTATTNLFREQEKLAWLLFNKFLELLEGQEKKTERKNITLHIIVKFRHNLHEKKSDHSQVQQTLNGNHVNIIFLLNKYKENRKYNMGTIFSLQNSMTENHHHYLWLLSVKTCTITPHLPRHCHYDFSFFNYLRNEIDADHGHICTN